MNGGADESLISLAPPNPIRRLVGTPWLGADLPSQSNLTLPSKAALAGLKVYVQGNILDPSGGGSVRVGLSGASELTLNEWCAARLAGRPKTPGPIAVALEFCIQLHWSGAMPVPNETIVSGVLPADLTPRAVRREFDALLDDGARLCPAGEAREDPAEVLRIGYAPRHRIDLLDASYFLTDYRFDDYINFLVVYMVLRKGPRGRVSRIHPRVFYKDSSLVWRVASHYIDSDDDYWIGKGEVRTEKRSDGEYSFSVEETTNLPYEIQLALDNVSRARKPVRDERAVPLFLRCGPPGRIEPYGDFTSPRRKATAERGLNGGRPIARFTRQNDPSSLVFARGFEPDFRHGVLENMRSKSRLYGGDVEKRRILSSNRRVQYQFISSPTHVFVNPPQTLDREITTYGTRALDVDAAEDAFLPGFEFHFVDEYAEPPALYTQIPEGFAGPPSEVDDSRADTSRWVETLPMVKEFRRRVLAPARRRHS
ncbi:MAG: hypothetical protein ACI8PQ_000365 [Planctomycetota bacterium]|jgi:hypothetical protein